MLDCKHNLHNKWGDLGASKTDIFLLRVSWLFYVFHSSFPSDTPFSLADIQLVYPLMYSRPFIKPGLMN